MKFLKFKLQEQLERRDLVVHAPSPVDEFQSSFVDQLPYDVLRLGTLLFPPVYSTLLNHPLPAKSSIRRQHCIIDHLEKKAIST